MGFISENIIPGNHGKVFGTNANDIDDFKLIKKLLLKLDGVKDVIFNLDIYPNEFTIHTKKPVEITKIQETVMKTGFHAIPKTLI
jgi:hypothetical protein